MTPSFLKKILPPGFLSSFSRNSHFVAPEGGCGQAPENVVIIGGGPAAHTAAIYTARALLRPILFEGTNEHVPGGQLMTTTTVENFPGFPKGVNGFDLMDLMREQSLNCGAQIYSESVLFVDTSSHPFTVQTSKRTLKTNSIIFATGATANKLDIPGAGTDGYWQRGVSACAVCEGALPIFRNNPIFIVGGGDSAMEEALYMSRYGSSVTIVHRRDQLRASKIMQEKVLKSEKIRILFSHEPVRLEGNESRLTHVVVKDLKADKEIKYEASGFFFAIGHTPNNSLVKDFLPLDKSGYVVLNDKESTRTGINGIFVCGDLADKKYRQAITAAGSGCKAALDCEKFIEDLTHKQKK